MILFETEAPTEHVTIEYTVPEGMDLSAYVPRNSIILAIASLIIVLAAIIILFAVVWKKQKGTLFGVIGGICAYVMFYNMAINAVNNILFMTVFKSFANNKYAVPLIVGLMCGTLPILGRMLMMKLFNANMKYVRDGLSHGIGIMGTEGAMSVTNFFFAIVTSNTINSMGLEKLLNNELAAEGATAETATNLLNQAFEIINYDAAMYIYFAIITIILMVFHVAASIPLYAAYKNDEPKYWYLITMGAYTLVSITKFYGDNKVIPVVLSIILMLIFTAAFSFFAVKIYMKHYKDEHPVDKKPSKAVPQEKKKMPKFENLSNL